MGFPYIIKVGKKRGRGWQRGRRLSLVCFRVRFHGACFFRVGLGSEGGTALLRDSPPFKTDLQNYTLFFTWKTDVVYCYLLLCIVVWHGTKRPLLGTKSRSKSGRSGTEKQKLRCALKVRGRKIWLGRCPTRPASIFPVRCPKIGLGEVSEWLASG